MLMLSCAQNIILLLHKGHLHNLMTKMNCWLLLGRILLLWLLLKTASGRGTQMGSHTTSVNIMLRTTLKQVPHNVIIVTSIGHAINGRPHIFQ